MADTTPPSSPGTLRASNITSSALTLNWDLTSDDTLTTAYDVYNGASVLSTVTAEQKWTERPAVLSVLWWNVFSVNDRFLVLGAGGSNKGMWSFDGLNWTPFTVPLSYYWRSTAFGNNYYVAIADGGTYSIRSHINNPNVWQQSSSMGSASWQSVAFGNGIFVAVKANVTTAVFTSTDGASWTSRTVTGANASAGRNVVGFGGGNFVILGDSKANGHYSANGVNWTATGSMTAGSWRSMAYGNGTFVATGPGYPYIIISKDGGLTWSQQSVPLAAFAVVFNNGMFLVIDGGTPRSTTSTDGINWTTPKDIPSTNWQSVAGNRGFFVATTNGNSDKIATYDYAATPTTTLALTQGTDYVLSVKARDADGNTSTSSTTVVHNTKPSASSVLTPSGITPTAITLEWDVSRDDGSVVAYNIYNGANLFTSVTPTNVWTNRTTPTSGNNNTVRVAGDQFVVLKSGSSKILTSRNGLTWVEYDLPSVATFYGAAYGNGVYVLVGDSVAASSTNGRDWTARSIPGLSWYDVVYGNGIFVAVSNSTTTQFEYSFDGVTWQNGGLPVSAIHNCIAFGNGRFVTLDMSKTTAQYSSDGINWTTSTLPGTKSWYGVAYGNGVFVAVAYGSNTGAVSSDGGVTWTSTGTMPGTSWFSMAFSNGQFVAVSGDSPIAAVSTDGVNWTGKNLPYQSYWSVAGMGGFFIASATDRNSTPTLDYAPTPRYTTAITVGNNYVFSVKSRDNSGIESDPSPLLIHPPDTTPPDVPVISMVTATRDSVSMSWNSNMDATLYEVFRDGVSQGTTAGTSFSQTVVDGYYSYTVRAKDAAGNWSTQSVPGYVTVDTVVPEPPPQPVIPPVIQPGTMIVTIVWDAVPDAVNYEVFRRNLVTGPARFGVGDPESIGFTTEPTFTDTTVPGPGTYGYSISAADAAGNWSPPSGEITANVTDPDVEPPAEDEELSGLGRFPLEEETIGRDPDAEFRRFDQD